MSQPLGRIYNALLKVWSYFGETEWESCKRDASTGLEKDENGKQNDV